MNPDLALTMKVVLGIAQLVVIITFVMWMIRKASVFQCPNCRKDTPLAQIRLARISCPSCGWNVTRIVVGAETVDGIAAGATPCKHCSSEGIGSEVRRLWDGNWYCMRCLDEAHSGLAEYARSHRELAETCNFSLWRALWGGICLTTIMAGMIAGLFALLGVVFVIVFAIQGRLPADVAQAVANLVLAVAMMFAFAWGFCSFISLPVGFAYHWWNRPRTIVVSNGRLLLKPPADQLFNLIDIRWAEASGRFDMAESICFPRRKGIILFPHMGTDGNKYRSEKVGYLVGLTPDMFAIWKAFLSLAEVPVQPTKPWKSIVQSKRSTAAASPS